MLSFEENDQGPFCSFHSPEEEYNVTALTGSVQLGSHHYKVRTLYVTEVVQKVQRPHFSPAFSSLGNSQGQNYYLGRKCPGLVAKARSAVNQGKRALSGYMTQGN